MKIRGSRGREREIEAVVDTGYTGWLTLPLTVISGLRLRLRWQESVRGRLADGSERSLDVYEAEVFWNRHARRVPVDEVDAAPLVGMALLEGYELRMQIRSGGKITIKRLPS